MEEKEKELLVAALHSTVRSFVEFPDIDMQTHSEKQNSPSSALCQNRGPSHQAERPVQKSAAPVSASYNQRAIKERTHSHTTHIYTPTSDMGDTLTLFK